MSKLKLIMDEFNESKDVDVWIRCYEKLLNIHSEAQMINLGDRDLNKINACRDIIEKAVWDSKGLDVMHLLDN